MNIDDLSILMGKSRKELEEMLKQNEIIELKLTESINGMVKDKCKIEIME